jgi:hypothetical protein
MKLKLVTLFLLIAGSLLAGTPRKDHSVLSSGTWYRISVAQSGIFKLTYQDLSSMGFDLSQAPSGNFRIYGNGGGMLPEQNSVPRTDDLREVSVKVVDGGDGKIDPGDYILFYGESPDNWIMNQNTHIFYHYKNLYSDSTYYYITVAASAGKKVGIEASLDTVPNSFSRRTSDFTFHEMDSLNLIKSGRIWYGEVFGNEKKSYDFSFPIPDLDTGSAVRVVTYVAARAPVWSWFVLSANGTKVDSMQVELSDLGSTTVFCHNKTKVSLVLHPRADLLLTLKYNQPTATSTGWLNYLELNYQRYLTWQSPLTLFRDPNSIGPEKLTKFIMTKATPVVTVWDISDPADVSEVATQLSHDTLTWILKTDSLRNFAAFDASQAYPVRLSGPVANQDLHALQPTNLVIITNPLFTDQAERLAAFHREKSGLTVTVTDVNQVFTEFGSGKRDLTAIRDFIKFLYDKGYPGASPKYVLLFGDGSYDPKNRVPGNNNMIPTFQSTESLNYTSSFVTDDYFGIMGINQGLESNGPIDIGLGRLPVTTHDQATTVVDKIIHYASMNDTIYSDWRNVMTFVADNPDKNLHFHQAEDLAEIVHQHYPFFNINKVYNDAYKMITTPTGNRIPDANTAISDAVKKGTLLLNYTGHGGEEGWSGCKVLTMADINSWSNYEKLPVFVTATCEFTRFDNPERFTAGEQLLVKPDGGAIALYSTTRIAFASYNFKLDSSFFLNLIPTPGGPYPRLGDLILQSKNYNNNNLYLRNFVLFGDPAQVLAYPQNKVSTTEIVSLTNPQSGDTAIGMTRMRVKGVVSDFQGSTLTGFNGIVCPKIYDKPVTYKTLGNTYGQQDGSYPENFQLQNNLIYNGKVSVKNGEFQFDFIVPRDIALNFGIGKISYYAKDSLSDAWGYDDSIIIGGSDPNAIQDTKGPDIGLFLDNEQFVSGSLIGASPLILSFLRDTSGINFLGIGFGHGITALLDGNTANPIDLNGYFVPATDTYTNGSIQYPLSSLSNGQHTLSLKAWDLLDNSAQKEVSFFVFDNPQVSVKEVFNYPNPFRESTTFVFTPGSITGKLTARIGIYTFQGVPVRTLEASFTEGLGVQLEVPWDGTDNYGGKLSSGMYVYRLLIEDQSGTFTQTSQKLVILR